ncbi:MAG: peptidylprolyl isomerase [Verrucomicrobiota bacterium]
MKGICAIAVAGILAGPGIEARADVVDGIKAVVHDSIITYQQVAEYTAPLVEQLHSRYGDQPDLFEKKLGEAEEDNLEQLLERQLILRDFETSGYTNALPDSIIDEEVQAYIHSNYGDDRVRFIKTLQAEGKTFEQFRKEFRERIVVQQMRFAHNENGAIISPHKIEVFYVDHKDQFKMEDQVKLRMIVLNKPSGDTNETRMLAEEILAKLNGGAAFTEMASVYSQGSQRNQGGDWGWVEKSVLRKELADLAFSLKPGQRSGVIDTPEACYLMMVEERRPEHVKPLSDVRDEIEKTLLAQESERLQKQWIERLKKKTFVRYF